MQNAYPGFLEENETMVRPVIHDPLFLSRKSAVATHADVLTTGQDLIETLQSNREVCAGMAANMIGEAKCIIAFFDENAVPVLMCNPEIMERHGAFRTRERCLSLSGERETVRYRMIKVRYRDPGWSVRTRVFSGWTAQVVQHEIDHTNGILI